MKPPRKDRSLAELRVTRKSNHDLQHQEGHGWAVSYADLLMVLLSFFICYFNFSDTTGPDGAIQSMAQMALAARGEKDLNTPGQAGKSNVAQVKDNGPAKENVSDVASALKLAGINLVENKDYVVIDLGGSGFRSGEFKIQEPLKKEINTVLEALKPYGDKVMITVIGHADSRPMRKRSELLQDNFDLSSMRALHVLKYMIKNGVPENRGSARAASSFDRNSRSVSVEVRMANAPKEGGES